MIDKTVKSDKVSWQSPSNIALVKYWGKYGNQLPQNTSVSLTLKNAYTQTTISFYPKTEKSSEVSVGFKFEGRPNTAFESKVKSFLTSVQEHFPFLSSFHLEIESQNSFPHSAGIASSASSMSALALCLCDMERLVTGQLAEEQEFYRKASVISRLGSGSACRSVHPYAAVWGKHEFFVQSSNEYAIPVEREINPVFKDFRDSILIISGEEKAVSSRAGHALMEQNPYAEIRYKQANKHLVEIMEAMKKGDLQTWGSIVEKEALTLHALMMASDPPYILMHPNTLTGIEKIQTFRKETNTPIYFTLDAGPNIHLLYPNYVKDKIIRFIHEELLSLCENNRVIHDQVGQGPVKIL